LHWTNIPRAVIIVISPKFVSTQNVLKIKIDTNDLKLEGHSDINVTAN